jgi:hypothetical protein
VAKAKFKPKDPPEMLAEKIPNPEGEGEIYEVTEGDYTYTLPVEQFEARFEPDAD